MCIFKIQNKYTTMRIVSFLLFISHLAYSQSTVVTNVNNPWGLAISDGILYIGEHGDNQVTSYDTNDANAALETIAGGLSGVSAVGVVGNELFIGERTSYAVSKVDLTDSSGELVACTTMEFPPIGFAEHSGYLYTGQREGNQVSRINLAAGCPTTFSTPLSGLDQSYGLGIKDDNLYVSQSNIGTISVVDLSTGKFVVNDLVSGLSTPGGMTVVDNTLYIADFGSGNLESVDLSAEVPEVVTVLTNLDGPIALASENGIVYIAEFNGNRISRYPELSNVADVTTDPQLMINPVPAQNTITIQFEGSATLPYQITNIAGQIVMQSRTQSNTTIDISMLRKGVYIVQAEGYQSQRIVKL